jgi:hypothetical protein
MWLVLERRGSALSAIRATILVRAGEVGLITVG